MRARLVDYSLLFFVLVEVVSGYASFLVGRPEGRWWFVMHGVLGLAISVLLGWKLRRVWPRLVRPALWDKATLAGVLALLGTALVLGSGITWTTWYWPQGYPNGLNWHVVFGTVLAVAVLSHMALRFRPLRRRDLVGRRSALRYLGVLAAGGVLWQGHQMALAAGGLPGARRRFTGSQEIGSGQGLAFPVTMWMLDNPSPLDRAGWRLLVSGAVSAPYSLAAENLPALVTVNRTATLDCTGGWYTTQRWRGLDVAALLARGGVLPGAVAVGFVSATGYRWSVPMDEVADLLLATHVGDQPLDHGHGAPLRLVAPGRRGFQWVKWVTEVRVLTAPDYGQWAAIFTSGL